MDMEYFRKKLFESLKIPKEILIDSESRCSSAATAMQQMQQMGVSLHEFQKVMINTFSSYKSPLHFRFNPNPADSTAMVDRVDPDPEGSRIQNKGW